MLCKFFLFLSFCTDNHGCHPQTLALLNYYLTISLLFFHRAFSKILYM